MKCSLKPYLYCRMQEEIVTSTWLKCGGREVSDKSLDLEMLGKWHSA